MDRYSSSLRETKSCGSIRVAVWMKLVLVGWFQARSIFCFYLITLLCSMLLRDMSRAPLSAENELTVVFGIIVWMPLLMDRNLLCNWGCRPRRSPAVEVNSASFPVAEALWFLKGLR